MQTEAERSLLLAHRSHPNALHRPWPRHGRAARHRPARGIRLHGQLAGAYPKPKPTPQAKRAAPNQIGHLFSNRLPDPRRYLGSNTFLAFCLLSVNIIWVKSEGDTPRRIPTFFGLPAVTVLFSSCLKNCKQIPRHRHGWEQRASTTMSRRRVGLGEQHAVFSFGFHQISQPPRRDSETCTYPLQKWSFR